MLLLVTCNMPMYTICNFACTCMFFSKNKTTIIFAKVVLKEPPVVKQYLGM